MTDHVAADDAVRLARLPRDERRRRILAAASEVFVRSGFHAAGMGEIAELAGVSKPVVYQHFASKRELHLAVLGARVDAFLEAIRGALGSTTDNRGRVAGTVSAIFAFADTDEVGFRLVFSDGFTAEPDVREELSRALEAATAAVEALVQSDSGLDADRSRLLAVGLVGTIRVSATDWLERGRPIPRADAVATTISLCWGGLSGIPLIRA